MVFVPFGTQVGIVIVGINWQVVNFTKNDKELWGNLCGSTPILKSQKIILHL